MAIDVYTKGRVLFFAAVGAAGLAALVWYGWSSSQYRTYRIETHDAVSGLIIDSPVELHGVEVGKVSKVELIDSATVRILLSIAKDAPISQATLATVATRGLTARGFAGYVYIAMENSAADAGPLTVEPGQAYPTIATAPARIDAMDVRVTEATERVEELTRLLQSVLDEPTVAALKRTMDGLQQITATMAANNEHLASLMTYADRDSRELQPVVQELRTMLPQLSRATTDLESLSRAITELANRVSRDPSVLLRGMAVPPGPGER